MMPTESTSLIANGSPSGTISNSCKGLWYGFSVGVCFTCLLVCSYLLGAFTGSSLPRAFNTGNESSIQTIATSLRSKTDEAASSTSPKYIATQFISFTINTLGGLDDYGECEGRSVDPKGVCYLGDMKNITNDVHHRLKIVKNLLTRIKNDSFKESPDIDHADNVLKIVAMPEFFWRGPNGAYSITELRTLYVVASDELRHLLSDEFYNDFLFCFGTIIAARSANDIREPWQSQLHATQIEYFNFSPIMKGGLDRLSYVVTKKYISGADFLSRTTLPNPSEEDQHDYAHFDKSLEELFLARNATVVVDNLIVLNDIRIGIEICLDHRLGVLWNDLLSRHHSELVDVLVIVSAGMAIERGPNPVVPGGVVYLSDGGASSAACLRPVEKDVAFHPNQVCRGDMSIIGLKHIPIGNPGYSSFFGLTACWDVEDLDLLRGYYSLYQTQGCAYTLVTYDIDVMDEFKFYPPSIEIYPTVSLPKPSVTP